MSEPLVQLGLPAQARRPTTRIAAVSLPFYTAMVSCYPALLLQAIVRDAGGEAEVFHGYLDFALDLIRSDEDVRLYKRLTHDPFFADLCLMPLLDGWHEEAHAADIEHAAQALGAPDTAVRERVRAVFARLVDRLVAELATYEVIGLTATHYQLVPSLILAQRLARLPGRRPRVVLGGYLASEEVARTLLAQHPAIDIVFFGEAEGGWLEAIERALRGERTLIRGRARQLRRFPMDYSAVLERVAAAPWLAKRFQISLELSRGCYWDKCDFCNFNVAYEGRFKAVAPAGVLADMDALHARHGQRRFLLLDTAVPHRLPRYLEQNDIRRDYDVFCEIRPDFTRRDLAGLTRLGRVRVQIGVESLVDAHLARMDKNSTVAENVRALLDCQELGIQVTWGVFIGHPRETAFQLRQLLRRVRRWTHLPPPKYVTHCEIRAGSPLWAQRQELGFEVQFPWPAFGLVLPPVPESSELIPVRTYTPALEPERRRIIGEIEEAVIAWQRAATGGPRLQVDGDTIIDRRCSPPVRRVLPALERALLRALRDQPRSRADLAEELGAPAGEVTAALDRLVAWDLMYLPDPLDAEAPPAAGAVALIRLDA